jgi:opacity protein-like surface antigen
VTVTSLRAFALSVRSALSVALVSALAVLSAAPAFAQQTAPPSEEDNAPVDLFGFKFNQSERYKFGGELVAGWSHDGAQASLGFEKQGRIGMAILSVSGRVSDHVRYYVSVNPVSETSSRPACGEPDFFFPNDPRLYAGQGPIITCDEEDGLKRVDTYNTFSLDYITQQGVLREGYIDWGLSDHVSLRGGRFILPIGFAPRDVGATSAKDMTRIMRLNAEANFGVMLAASARRATRAVFDAGVMVVLGDGNREKDYDWFYFVNRSLDTNSAVTVVASARLQPIDQLDVRASYKRGYTGSKVERLPSYWASKRNDDALVVSVKISPLSWASAFAEYANYKWGPTITSGELVGIPTLGPIEKPGYYMGAQLDVPVSGRVRVGGSVTREELTRDDSLIQYLSLNNLYGVEMGKKDRSLIARGFVDVNRLVNVSFFWMDVSNPFPWASGIWPVSGPVAFTGRALDRVGVTVTVRTP